MKWPFGNNLEMRAESSYTDTLVGLLVGRAQGKSLSTPTATAALEACSGLTGRGFASAEVSRAGLAHPGIDTWGIGTDRPLAHSSW